MSSFEPLKETMKSTITDDSAVRIGEFMSDKFHSDRVCVLAKVCSLSKLVMKIVV
jgi:hypothetical protein